MKIILQRGIFERLFKDKISDEQKQQDSLDWFDSLLEISDEADD